MKDAAALSKVGGVAFDEASVEDLFTSVEVWGYGREDMPYHKERYFAAKRLTEGAAALGYKWKAPDFVDWGGGDSPPRTWDRCQLGLLASEIEEIWRRCGGKGKPGWNDKDGRWTGPVTEVILELRQLDIKPVPGRSTIRDAMREFPKIGTAAGP